MFGFPSNFLLVVRFFFLVIVRACTALLLDASPAFRSLSLGDR